MAFLKNHIKFSIKLIVLLVMIVIFILFIILKSFPNIAEDWSNSFVRIYIVIFGSITKNIPVSITELLAVILMGLSITFLVLAIIDLCKKRFFKSVNKVANILLIIFAILMSYQTTAEMMYQRKPLELPLYEEKVTKDKFKEIINYFIDDLNECCNHLEFYEDGDVNAPSNEELNSLLEKEYEKMNSSYLFDFTVKTKPMYLTSWLYREFHISGVTFIPLGEANVNFLNVSAGKGFTAAHELAHTKGAMREADADLVASYITLHSSNYFLRYSGYYYTISSLLFLGGYTGVDGDYQELVSRIDARWKKNMQFNNDYWRKHNKASEFANFWNDLYLKMSGQKEGTDSYGDSEISVDQTKREITTFSNYQKMYFEIYYSHQ